MLSQLPLLWLPRPLILLAFLCFKFINKLSVKREQHCSQNMTSALHFKQWGHLEKGEMCMCPKTLICQGGSYHKFKVPMWPTPHSPSLPFCRQVAEQGASPDTPFSFMPKISFVRPSFPSQILSSNLRATVSYRYMRYQKSVIPGTCFSHHVVLGGIPWCCNNY